MKRCRRCGVRIHRTHWTFNGWKHFAFYEKDGWAVEDRDHNAQP